MNPFVNLKKRGVSLPKGCKDLRDVLLLRERKPAAPTPAEIREFIAFSGRLIAAYRKRLENPELTPVVRARMRKHLQEMKRELKEALEERMKGSR